MSSTHATRDTPAVGRHVPGEQAGRALPSDYEGDPDRFAANQLATRRFLAGHDVHLDVAERFVDEQLRRVADIGGGNGALARLLVERGIGVVVVDRARYVALAPRPVVLADACHLPFADHSFDAAAALWMLYHLPDPLVALREARRVLRAGGLLAVCAPSRHNDPELAAQLPHWGKPLSFDAENGPGLLRQVFDDCEIHHWDTPLVHLPDREALGLYLRGRGLSEHRARTAAGRTPTPLTLTKRGMIGFARKSD